MSDVEARGLQAGYGRRTVLDGVDVRFGAGLHLLLGPNGAGKTTLFRTLTGVLQPTAGQVLIDGRSPVADPSVKHLVGFGGHRVALAPRLSVEDNLQYWGRLLGMSALQRNGRVPAVLSLLGLEGIAARQARGLSRGQAQRVSVARALLADPPILLLDEPLSGLDPGVTGDARRLLRRLADDGHTVVVSTHELREVSDIGDDVTILQGGRITGRRTMGSVRRSLLEGTHLVRLRGRGDLAGTLRRLGCPSEAGPDGTCLVEVPDEVAVERLVADLVSAGVGLWEVAPANDALEDLYLHLSSLAGAAGEQYEAVDAG